MIGPTKNISKAEKQRIVDNYVKEHHLYASKPSIGINLRELSKYCRESNINTKEVPDTILSKFRIK